MYILYIELLNVYFVCFELAPWSNLICQKILDIIALFSSTYLIFHIYKKIYKPPTKKSAMIFKTYAKWCYLLFDPLSTFMQIDTCTSNTHPTNSDSSPFRMICWA